MFDMKAICMQIDRKIFETGCNTNPFYELIQRRPLKASELKFFADQIYLNMMHFPRAIAGLSARVEDDAVCAELAHTVVVELGEGKPGRAHSELFEKTLVPMGISVTDWRSAYHTPETLALVKGVRDLFLSGPTLSALGGNYALERTGLPMLQALYEGFRLLPGASIASMEYFYLHLAVEAEHIESMAGALRVAMKQPADAVPIEEGAVRVGRLLNDFWVAIHRGIENGQYTAADDSSLQCLSR